MSSPTLVAVLTVSAFTSVAGSFCPSYYIIKTGEPDKYVDAWYMKESGSNVCMMKKEVDPKESDDCSLTKNGQTITHPSGPTATIQGNGDQVWTNGHTAICSQYCVRYKIVANAKPDEMVDSWSMIDSGSNVCIIKSKDGDEFATKDDCLMTKSGNTLKSKEGYTGTIQDNGDQVWSHGYTAKCVARGPTSGGSTSGTSGSTSGTSGSTSGTSGSSTSSGTSGSSTSSGTSGSSTSSGTSGSSTSSGTSSSTSSGTSGSTAGTTAKASSGTIAKAALHITPLAALFLALGA